MKIKLTPKLSYIIGLWRKNQSSEGLGVIGEGNLLEVFSKEALDNKLTTSEKIQTEENKVYFYHTAYRRFFQQIVKEQLERFKYLNEYAASYVAGLFDAVGEIDDKGIVSFYKANRKDEMMLLRLGFVTRRKADRLIIEKPILFLTFIKNYVKMKKGHKAFGYLNK